MIAYRDALPEDGPALAAMARRCFAETFGTLYQPQDLAAFLDSAFGPDGLPAQIGDPAFAIRLGAEDDRIAGFAKVGPNALPIEGDDLIELYQLYVLRDWQGAGVAAALMDWVFAIARARGAQRLCLSVYVDNHRAKAFYARYGFVDVGRYDFPVGGHIDEDRLMVAPL
jgi:ribosomal protein S18 acetylase RimI-like enzyme